jgi:hypothetical protein
MRGAIGSLNAAVAGSILLFAAVAQRDPAGLGDNPARPVGADAWPVRNEPPNAATRATPTEEERAKDETKPVRGQSVGLPSPDETATAVADRTARSRRRSATNAAHPGGNTEPPVGEAPPRRRPRTKADNAGSAIETPPEQAKPRRTAKPAATAASRARAGAGAAGNASPAATANVPSPEVPSGTAKPIRRRARRAAQLEPAPEPPTGSEVPARTKPARPRAIRRATEATGQSDAVKPARRRAATKNPDVRPEPAANDGSGDDLLPGGPDPA